MHISRKPLKAISENSDPVIGFGFLCGFRISSSFEVDKQYVILVLAVRSTRTSRPLPGTSTLGNKKLCSRRFCTCSYLSMYDRTKSFKQDVLHQQTQSNKYLSC